MSEEEEAKKEVNTQIPEVEASSATGEEIIARSEAVAKRMEDANVEAAKLALRIETANIERTLAGKADAGGSGPKEESAQDYAKRVISGDVEDKK